MSKVKGPAIKLFGRTIPLPLNRPVSANESSGSPASPEDCSHHHTRISSSSEDSSGRDKEPSRKELTSDLDDGGASHQTTEDLKSPTSSVIFENPRVPSPSADRETSLLKSSRNGEQSETSTPQDKAPKKPDKILPCPRCSSMDTKFCYYNNYNVSQPRHFCKNCQRYWTAGGNIRNVPVGAGRRKNKNPCATHYRHLMVPEALLTAKANAANGLHNAVLGNGTTVLTFGEDSSTSDSMASELNLAEKTQNGVLNSFLVPEQNIIVSYVREDNGDDNSIGASVTTSTSSEKRANAASQESMDKSYEGFPPQLPCFPASPWSYPWNSVQWSSPVPPPALGPPGYPVSFYPTPTYWGCTLPASWNIPYISPQSSMNHSAPSFGPNSPTLGKHSRDGNILTPAANSQREKPDIESKNSENTVLIPKTLRIDDPGEAAKSSIWSTLGIRNEKANSLNGGGLFKAFPSKGDDKNHVVEALPMLQANPAALSRSRTFHERA